MWWEDWEPEDYEVAAKVQATPVGRALLEYLAGKKTDANDWVVAKDVSAGGKVSYPDVIWFLKELDGAFFGAFLVGRRGKVSRFKWRTAPAAILRQLNGRLDKDAPGNAVEEEAVSGETPSDDDHSKGDITEALTLEHPFRLRPGFVVNVRLPADMTKGEANRLATFVTSLPFEP